MAAMYQVDGWEGLVPLADLQNYLDTQQLYEDNWVTIVPDHNGVGWQALKDVLKPASPEFATGTRVEGLYSDGTWYHGTVQGKNPAGTYLVAFDGFEAYPPEPCSEVKLEGGAEVVAAAAEPAAPVAPVAPAAVAPAAVAPAAPAADGKVWHVLASDGANTNGPFSVDDLSKQLRDGVVLESTAMIHETGADWVLVGTVATAAAPEQSAKKFAAAQTRRRHSRKASVTVVLAPAKPRAPSQTGSRGAPVKSGSSTYRKNDGYDQAGAMVICQWMELILDRQIATSADDFMDVLKNETHIFAELFNTFKPGSTRKVKKSKMRFKQ